MDMKLLLVLTIIALFVSFIPNTYSWSRWSQFYEEGGCVFSQCPYELQQRAIEEEHGMLPPQYYEKDTKDYWRSYFNYNDL